MDALGYAQRQLNDLGPYEIVNVFDPASVQTGVDLLATETGYGGSRRQNSVSPGAGPDGAAGSDGATDTAGDWFNGVFIPDVERQYIEKKKAKDQNQPWNGKLFRNTDASVPGPSDQDRDAIRERLTRALLPLFEQQLG